MPGTKKVTRGGGVESRTDCLNDLDANLKKQISRRTKWQLGKLLLVPVKHCQCERPLSIGVDRRFGHGHAPLNVLATVIFKVDVLVILNK